MANSGTNEKCSKIKINKETVEQLPYADKGKQIDFWDTSLIGFGIRVSHTSKTYIAMSRVKGKLVRVTIGKHSPLTAKDAREKAKIHLGEMTTGTNHNKEKAKEKVRGITLEKVAKQYFETQDLKESTANIYKLLIDAHMATWKTKAMSDISGDMVKKKFMLLEKDNGRVAAINTMKVLRLMYNYAAKQDGSELKDNPVKSLSAYMGKWSKVERRKTSISDEMLPVWWKSLDVVTSPPAKDLLKMLLFTGMRKNEAMEMKWSEVDMKGKTFTLLDPKNRNDITLPMSTTIEEIFQSRLDTRMNDYVFPGNKVAGHMVDVRKQIGLMERESIKILNGIETDADLDKAINSNKSNLIPGFTFMPHDLRRTFSTIAQNIVSYPELKRLMNHSTGDDVTQGYLILTADKLREPMQRVTDRINEIINGPPTLPADSIDDESKVDLIKKLISELGTDKILELVKNTATVK